MSGRDSKAKSTTAEQDSENVSQTSQPEDETIQRPNLGRQIPRSETPGVLHKPPKKYIRMDGEKIGSDEEDTIASKREAEPERENLPRHKKKRSMKARPQHVDESDSDYEKFLKEQSKADSASMIEEVSSADEEKNTSVTSESHETEKAKKFTKSYRGPNLITRKGRQERTTADNEWVNTAFTATDDSEPPETERVQQKSPEINTAEKFTKAYRGPNLNIRSSVDGETNRQSFDYDWALAEPSPYIIGTDPSPPPSPPPSITPPPSVGTTRPQSPDDIFSPNEQEVQQKAAEYDEKIKKINRNKWAEKPLTKIWADKVMVQKTQRAVYEENTEQVQEGLKVVDVITEKPLNRFFSLITTLLPQLLFATSIIIAVVDIIISQAEHAHYTLTCFFMDLVEVIFLTCTFFIKKSRYYKRMSDERKESFDKRQQLIDNILAETLLFPTIICSLVGIVTDRQFELAKFVEVGYNADIGRSDLVLITFDIISLSYVYGARMYMVQKFMNSLKNEFPEATNAHQCCGITTRVVYTVACNALVFGAMLLQLGLQLYHENFETEEPNVSGAAGFMIVATLIVPILSIVVFILANYFYILELMIRINQHVQQRPEFREKIPDNLVGKGIVGFASKNIHNTKGRLRDIMRLTTFGRLFYVLREWWIDLVFFIWSAICVIYCYLVYVFVSELEEGTTYKIVYLCSFMLTTTIFIYANFHSFMVVAVINVILVPLCISYGLQALIDKCRELKQGKPDTISLLEKNDSSVDSRQPTPEDKKPVHKLSKTITSERSLKDISIARTPAPSRLEMYGSWSTNSLPGIPD